eukprot:scaffold1594_cov171-Ochromonas_danica.AAC.5
MNAVDPFPNNPTYVSIEGFSDTNCQNAYKVGNIVLNVCLANEKGSIKYSCENGIPYLQEYDDLACTTLTSKTSNNGACIATPDGMSYKWSCDATSAYDYPEGDYYVMTTYQSNTCNAEIIETIAILNGFCFPGEDTNSYMCQWPYIYSYPNSLNCEGFKDRSDPAFTCPLIEPTDGDDYVGYNAYLSYSNVVVNDDDNSDDSLSGWKIAVIVVCSVIGFVLIAGVAYYFLVMKKKSEPMSSQAKADNLELTCSMPS